MDKNEILEAEIEYIIVDNTVTVISYKSYGTTAYIPEKIKGLLVTKIGPYAFSNIEKSKERIPKDLEVYKDVIAGLTVPGSRNEYICGRRLEEVYLPKTLQTIDEYAFYDCRELHAIHIWGGKIQIENGSFMNCEKLTKIYMEAYPDDVTCAYSILTEISEEVTIIFTRNQKVEAVFIFPEYYEDAVENTPARVLHYQIYGAGYRYRQCFKQRKLHIFSYDLVFESAEIQSFKEAALKIAYGRLKYPYQLQESLKNKYLEYIAFHMDIAMKMAIIEEDLNRISFLTSLGILSEDDYKSALEEALRLGKKECASILLKEKLHYYPPTEKTYEF